MTSLIHRVRHAMAHRFWSLHHEAEDLVSWIHEPRVRQYINESVSGSPNVWPMDWFRDYADRGFDRGASIGCGVGALERDLASKGICREIVGIDISQAALGKADKRALEDGYDHISYRPGDFNGQFLHGDEGFDIVFFHQALHHVENLEGCMAQVAASLRTDGWLFLDEYIGPSRGDWNREMIGEADRHFQQIPRPLRRHDHLKLPVDWRDPSEAIRSADIMDTVQRHFVQREMRGYGGNLVALIYPHLALDDMTEDVKNGILDRLIEAERQLIAEAAAPYYAVWIGERIVGSNQSA